MYLPYSELSGEIQKGRLMLWGPRYQIMIKFEEPFRPRIMSALGHLHHQNSHSSVQWFLEELRELPVCFTVEEGWIKHSESDQLRRLAKPEFFQEFFQPWPLTYNGIPFYTWFRHKVLAFEFAAQEVELLLIRDPDQFLELCRILFFQAKAIIDILLKKFEQEHGCFSEESIIDFTSEILAYGLTIEPSLKALQIESDSRLNLLPATKKLINLFEQSERANLSSIYCILMVMERFVFLDDHPIKALLKKIHNVEIFQRDFDVIAFPMTNKKDSFYHRLEARGRLSLLNYRSYKQQSLAAFACMEASLGEAITQVTQLARNP